MGQKRLILIYPHQIFFSQHKMSINSSPTIKSSLPAKYVCNWTTWVTAFKVKEILTLLLLNHHTLTAYIIETKKTFLTLERELESECKGLQYNRRPKLPWTWQSGENWIWGRFFLKYILVLETMKLYIDSNYVLFVTFKKRHSGQKI